MTDADLGGIDTGRLGERLARTLSATHGYDVPGEVLVAVLRKHFAFTAETFESVAVSDGTGTAIERRRYSNFILTGGN